MTVENAQGWEDTPVDLNIGPALADVDGSESITGIVISGVPTGATLSAGTDNGNGSWTLTPAQLDGLQLFPAANSDQDFTLSVAATSTEADGSQATTVATLDVAINGVADTPTVTVQNATGAEDSAIPLNIGVALADTDGSESISAITISGVPAGASLSAGTDNGDGTVTIGITDHAQSALGDIVYPSGRSFHYFKHFWPTYVNATEVSEKAGAPLMATIPFYAVLGNHDTTVGKLGPNLPDAYSVFYFFFSFLKTLLTF